MTALEEKYRKLETEFHILKEKQLADHQENEERKRQYEKKIKNEDMNKRMLNSEIERLHERIETMGKEHERALQKIKLGHESEVKKLKEKAQLNENNQVLNDEIQMIAQRLQTAERKLREISEQNETLKDEKEAFKENSCLLKSRLDQLSEENAKLKEELELQCELKDRSQEAERAKDQLARRLAEEKEALNADKVKLSSEIDLMRASLAGLSVSGKSKTQSHSSSSTASAGLNPMHDPAKNRKSGSVFATSNLIDDLVSQLPNKMAEKRKSQVLAQPVFKPASKKNLILSDDEDEIFVSKPIQEEKSKKVKTSSSKAQTNLATDESQASTLYSIQTDSNQDLAIAAKPKPASKKSASTKKIVKHSAAEVVPDIDDDEIPNFDFIATRNDDQSIKEKEIVRSKNKKKATDRRVSFAPSVFSPVSKSTASASASNEDGSKQTARATVATTASSSVLDFEPADQELAQVKAPAQAKKAKRKGDSEEETCSALKTVKVASARPVRGAAREARKNLCETSPKKQPLETKATQTDDEDDEDTAAVKQPVKETKRKVASKSRK